MIEEFMSLKEEKASSVTDPATYQS
jgi:hypothetical protein